MIIKDEEVPVIALHVSLNEVNSDLRSMPLVWVLAENLKLLAKSGFQHAVNAEVVEVLRYLQDKNLDEQQAYENAYDER